MGLSVLTVFCAMLPARATNDRYVSVTYVNAYVHEDVITEKQTQIIIPKGIITIKSMNMIIMDAT